MSSAAVREAMRAFGAQPVALAEVPAAAPPARAWSPMQSAIFDAVTALEPARHLVIEALAGTGKSTTIEECVERVPLDRTILVCAFNKAIATALEARLPGDCDVMTLHSLGARIIRTAMGSREVATGAQKPAAQHAKALIGTKWETWPARVACEKLVGLAKGCLAEEDPDALDKLADAYEIEIPPAYKTGISRAQVLRAAVEILQRCREVSTGPIDFDDMIWLPEARALAAPTWDYVFVDETQDLNAAQLALVRRVAGAEGRIVAVGDRRQAIYGFRGADRSAIPRMIRELDARTLPLSITYRCPRLVVAEANRLVPELAAAPSAPTGIVRHTLTEELRAEAAPGDMVLSRTNAPLVALCYRWIASGRRAVIQGRDIGSGLIAWIKGIGAGSVGQLMRQIGEWHRLEVARLTEAERPTQSVDDKAECLTALCEGCATVDAVIEKCERLFADGGGDGAILLSSTHRAKGLEAERVWILRDTYCRWPGAEEDNLLYVAITRSKQELIYVHEKAEDAESEEP
jgi:DNA helicase II / ATP-dependent DNA helicase PcrA